MHKFYREMLPAPLNDLLTAESDVHCHITRYATNQNYVIQVSKYACSKSSF